ncbi:MULTISPECIES: hypothetical protein [Bradyrhizobium]|jgi:hypothetical protein|uniref:hypothetical protein n=1 Tax=Bradyrhizobium elkanii TaxID=29448 RepID=UPI002714D171|nr:hypothetical protein [Bradyrhizobium elkanii]WLA47304.1 hypothetical protein QIH80_37375 [Bradyrhizobium elkanii]WLB82400.1 hypothetical protein QIH83_07400 [Bradyrhizobium elkanii]
MDLKPGVLGGAILILAALGCGVWILKPRDIECAGAEARALVAQIATENQAALDELITQYVRANSTPKLSQAPKSAERIAAENRIAALKEAVAKANREWIDSVRPGGQGSPQVLNSGNQVLNVPRPNNDASRRATLVRQDLFIAQRNYDFAYGEADRAARAADDKADAANRAAASATLRNEVRYTLDDVRTTDKNLVGALTCAATLNAKAGKYDWTLPITFKVEQTSDRKLYVTVYGLKKF